MSNVVHTVASKIPPGAVALKFWSTPGATHSSSEEWVEYHYGQAILWRLTAEGFIVMTDETGSSQIQDVVIGSYHSR